MEIVLFFYVIIFVLPPLLISLAKEQPWWAIILNLLCSVIISPVLALVFILGGAWGSLNLGIFVFALLFLLLPYAFAFTVGGKQKDEPDCS